MLTSLPSAVPANPACYTALRQTIALLKKGAIGSLYNGAGVKINLELQRVAVEESRLGIPLIFGADVWHGMHTVFPIPLGEAASWEPALANLTARATAIEATAAGIFWTYSPMVDVARDQRWGRVRGSPNHTPSPISPTYAQEAAYCTLQKKGGQLLASPCDTV